MAENEEQENEAQEIQTIPVEDLFVAAQESYADAQQRAIEENKSFANTFKGLFSEINLNSDKLGRTYTERNKLLCKVITRIAKGIAGFSTDTDILGDAYEYLIGEFAAGSGQSAGEFYTPQQISTILSRLVALDTQDPKSGNKKRIDRALDFACGSGSLLLNVRKQVGKDGIGKIYGQEKNITTYNLARMNMLLHGVKDTAFEIYHGDSLANDWDILSEMNPSKKMEFDAIVANPPFSLDKWDSGFLSGADTDEKGKKEKMSASLDQYKRFDWGVPPSSKGDYAFVLHMLHSLDAENGRMGVVLPHGVLFRGASEGRIRQQLIEMNLLDAVIGLPANLFYGTGIPACILIFKKNRMQKDVLFIDASGDGNYEKGKNQNILRDCDIEKIVQTYDNRKSVDKLCYKATFEEIKANDFNLNIPRYVDTFEEEVMIDIDEVKQNIVNFEAELVDVQAQMQKYLTDLGL